MDVDPEEEAVAVAASPTPAWDGDRYDENGDQCSIPGCGRTHYDDGVQLSYVSVLINPDKEGYGEVTQALCCEHLDEVTAVLISLGFGSHNHHGTNLLGADDMCGGYAQCLTPADDGPELVRPESSTYVPIDAIRERIHLSSEGLAEILTQVLQVQHNDEHETELS